MYRIDIRVYFLFKRMYLFFFSAEISWLFSARYSNIVYQDKINDKLEEALVKQSCKIIKKEKGFLSVLWNGSNLLNFRLENHSFGSFDLHFYTSKFDIPYKFINRKIITLSKIFEIVENNIDMVDRNAKKYEMQIIYSENNPYYSYWIKTMPGEKIKTLNCKLYDNDNDVIEIHNNQIRFMETSLQGLFYKAKNYLSLRGI
jgi:hypothetical protein